MLSPQLQPIFDFITDDVPHVGGYLCGCNDCQIDRFIAAVLFNHVDESEQEIGGIDSFTDYIDVDGQHHVGYFPPSTSPDNVEMHSYNGNAATLAPEMLAEIDAYNAALDAETSGSGYMNYFRSALRGLRPQASRTDRFAAGTLGQILGITLPIGLWGSGVFETPDEPKHYDSKIRIQDINVPDFDNIDGKPVNIGKPPKEEIVPKILPKPTEISNKDSHIANGNIVPLVKMSKKTRKVKRRVKPSRNATKRLLKKETKILKTIAKSRPKISKGIKEAGSVDLREKKLANAYSRFLKAPMYRPPKLGGTGSNPTKILHGYYTTTINMSSFEGVANQTSLLAFISPVMFMGATSITNFSAPIAICTAATSTQAFSAAGTTVSSAIAFTNDTALKNETLGSTTNGVSYPLARYLGGSISFQCRCPLTTNPPFLYGGLIPSNPQSAGVTTDIVDLGQQLNRLTGAQVLGLTSSCAVPGMSVSSVYQPASARDLEFNPFVAQYNNSGVAFRNMPIAYVGMNGCPTTATVQVTASMWFEIQQTKDNYNYSGWGLGPRVSPEDIFDFLKPFPSCSTRPLSTGAKSNMVGFSEVASLLAANQPPLKSVDRLTLLEERLNRLQLLVEDDEDEKYFEAQATPSLDREIPLSKSTIDLALSLRKALTPGSVTNKTIQPQNQ